MKRGVVALVFRCLPVGSEEHTSDESVDVCWFTREEVKQHMVEAYAVRVVDALDAGGPQVRAHDGQRLLTENVPVS